MATLKLPTIPSCSYICLECSCEINIPFYHDPSEIVCPDCDGTDLETPWDLVRDEYIAAARRYLHGE